MAHVRFPTLPAEDELNEEDEQLREYHVVPASCCTGCYSFLRTLGKKVRKENNRPLRLSVKQWLVSLSKRVRSGSKDKKQQMPQAKGLDRGCTEPVKMCPGCRIRSCEFCQGLHVDPKYIDHCILDHYNEAGRHCVRHAPPRRPGSRGFQFKSWPFLRLFRARATYRACSNVC